MNLRTLIFTLSIGLFSVFTSIAQEFQGMATYLSKTKVNFDFGDRKVPQDAKERMLKRMEEQMQKTFELRFNKKASIYKEEAKLAAVGGEDSRGRMFASVFGGASAGEYYKSNEDKESKRAVEFFGKNFLVEDDLQNFNWKLGSDSKQIGKYTAYKATADVDEVKNPFSKKTEGESTQIEITVWYTPQIPVSTGPDKYWGLPGLILEVQAGETQIACTKVVLNVKEKMDIRAPKSGKKISEADFKKIVDEKTAEMRERFKGGGRGPGGTGGRGGAR